MLLLGIPNEGLLIYEGIEPTFEEEIALTLDEDAENVKVVSMYLQKVGLMQQLDTNSYVLAACIEFTGREAESTQRVRQFREREKEQKQEVIKLPPKTNKERQRQFRAKQYCQDKRHIPYIEDYQNNKRYSGNYYLVFKRDACKCSICGSVENLCVHHIDGYDEDLPQNNQENKLLTLCRTCHQGVHYGSDIPKDILQNIGYYSSDGNNSNGSNDQSNESNESNEEHNESNESSNKRNEMSNETSNERNENIFQSNTIFLPKMNADITKKLSDNDVSNGSNVSNVTCNADTVTCNTEIELEIELEIEKSKNIKSCYGDKSPTTHAPKKSKQNKQSTDIVKISFAEFVSMTNDEYMSLITEFGEPMTLALIKKLDNYKGATGKQYKSDFRAIKSWVITSYYEDQAKSKTFRAIDLSNTNAFKANYDSLNKNIDTPGITL